MHNAPSGAAPQIDECAEDQFGPEIHNEYCLGNRCVERMPTVGVGLMLTAHKHHHDKRSSGSLMPPSCAWDD